MTVFQMRDWPCLVEEKVIQSVEFIKDLPDRGEDEVGVLDY